MAVKVTYPTAPAPAAPTPTAAVIYHGAAAGVPAPDASDRIGGAESFTSNPMPRGPATDEQKAFASHVVAVRTRIVAACQGVPVEVAIVSLMAAALEVGGDVVPDAELVARLEATARDYQADDQPDGAQLDENAQTPQQQQP
jgi:hypothetical protein